MLGSPSPMVPTSDPMSRSASPETSSPIRVHPATCKTVVYLLLLRFITLMNMPWINSLWKLFSTVTTSHSMRPNQPSSRPVEQLISPINSQVPFKATLILLRLMRLFPPVSPSPASQLAVFSGDKQLPQKKNNSLSSGHTIQSKDSSHRLKQAILLISAPLLFGMKPAMPTQRIVMVLKMSSHTMLWDRCQFKDQRQILDFKQLKDCTLMISDLHQTMLIHQL